MNQGTNAVIISITFTVFSGLILILRCISRFLIVKKGGLDDALVILSWLGMVAVTYMIWAQYDHGLGLDMTEVGPLDLMELLKNLWASIIAYGLSATFLKVSALTQYLRFLFDRGPRVCCFVMMALTGFCGVAFIFTTIFSCQPISYSWDKTIPGGTCVDVVAWWYSAAAWIILSDIAVVVLPIVTVKNLTMPPGQKKALIVVFALGGLGCIASILRLWAIHKAASSMNITKSNAAAAYWSVIEINLGIVSICLPPMKGLYLHLESRYEHVFRGRRSGNERLASSDNTAPMEQMNNQSPLGVPAKKKSQDPYEIPV